MIIVLCMFLALLAAPTLEQDSQASRPQSPCPQVFMYDRPEQESDWWSGVVNVSTKYLLHSLWLDIELDRPALDLRHRAAHVTTQNFKNFRIEMEDLQIHPGFPISVRFLVKYDSNAEVPRLQAIGMNGKAICNAIMLQSAKQTISKLRLAINPLMQSMPPSPCPDVFMYDPPGSEPGWWTGDVHVSTNSRLHSLWLDIVLDRQALELQHKTAQVTTVNFRNFRIEMEDLQIRPDFPLSLHFSVKYDLNTEAPRLQAIGMNGKVICNAVTLQSTAGQPDLSFLRLNTSTNFNLSPPMLHSVIGRPDDDRTAFGINFHTKTGLPIRGEYESGRLQCGYSSSASNWPWFVAIYRINNVDYEFRCGGSLLNHRHVITAGQCVHTPPSSSTQTVINTRGLMVHLGKRNLINSIRGVQIRFVRKIIVAPGYNQTYFYDQWNYNNDRFDVAILELQETVTYTESVQPVCLWPNNVVNLGSIVGKNGWVVGWGFNSENVVIDQLSEVEVPVVSQETCVEANVDFYGHVVTNDSRTYCAGSREDTLVCKGSTPGSGMFFRIGNSWYLRGHISLVLFRQLDTALLCDPTQYMVFSDVAKYVPWIKQVISNH